MKIGFAIAWLCVFICGCTPAPESGTAEKTAETRPGLQTDSGPGEGTDSQTEAETPHKLLLDGLTTNVEFFTIQVAAVSDEETAKRIMGELEGCGYPTVQEKVQRSDGRRLIRIRTGIFLTGYEASYSLETLSAWFKDPILIKLDRAPEGVYEIVRVDPDRMSQVERSIFYDHQLKYCRRLLSETSKRCLSDIEDREFMAEESKAEWKQHFISSQKLWEELLKTDAKAMEIEMYGGSGAGLVIQSYQIRQTAQRILTLKERYGLN